MFALDSLSFSRLRCYSLLSSCIYHWRLAGYGQEKSEGKDVSVAAFCLRAIIPEREGREMEIAREDWLQGKRTAQISVKTRSGLERENLPIKVFSKAQLLMP